MFKSIFSTTNTKNQSEFEPKFNFLTYEPPTPSYHLPQSFQYRKFINWMSFLAPETLLRNIVFPGTLQSSHFSQAVDSFTETLFKQDLEFIDKTLLNNNYQGYNIIAQLILGVRYLSFDCEFGGFLQSEGKSSSQSHTQCEPEQFNGQSQNEEGNPQDKFIPKMKLQAQSGGLPLKYLLDQVTYFFDNFDTKNTEMAILNFQIINYTEEKEILLKSLLEESMEMKKYGVVFNKELTFGEIKTKGWRYLVMIRCNNSNLKLLDYFLNEKDWVCIKPMKFWIKNQGEQEFEVKYEEKPFILQEFCPKLAGFTPAFFEKIYGHILDSQLEEYIKKPEFSKINIFARHLIEKSPNFIKNIIVFNEIRGNIKQNCNFELLMKSSPHAFIEYSMSKSYKYSENGLLTIGNPKMPNHIILYNKEFDHKIFFESLLTTCFTKKEEIISLEAPDGYLLSFISVLVKNQDKTNKFKFIIKNGWILEKSFGFTVKALRNFQCEVLVEAVPLDWKLFRG